MIGDESGQMLFCVCLETFAINCCYWCCLNTATCIILTQTLKTW